MDMLKNDLSDPMSDSEFDDVSLQQLLADGDDHGGDPGDHDYRDDFGGGDHDDDGYRDHDDDHGYRDHDHDHDHDHDNSLDNSHDHTDPSLSTPMATHPARTDSVGSASAAAVASAAASAAAAAAAAGPKKKYDPKDPLRPRRKKARRACFACQRAHLTCGDERPCQRCIKRGIADGCQDGVRKKAKYLHDAPPEALGGVLGPAFAAAAAAAAAAGGGPLKTAAAPGRPNGHRHPSSAGSDVSASNVSYFGNGQQQQQPQPQQQQQQQQQQPQPPAYPVFSTGQTAAGAGPLPDGLPDGMAFSNGPQSPVSPGFVGGPPSNDGGGGGGGSGNGSGGGGGGGLGAFSPALFDPSNPALFNFNLEGISFGSQYAAMEFGMLGHMSSGAADDPADHLSASSLGGGNAGGGGNTGNSGGGGFGGAADVFSGGGGGGGLAPTLYDGGGIGGSNDYMSMDAPLQGFYAQGNLQHGLPHAYAIAAAPPSLQSPSTDTNSPQPTAGGGGGGGGGGGNAGAGFEGSPTTTATAYGLGGRTLSNGGGSNGNNNNNGRSSFSAATPSTPLALPPHKPTTTSSSSSSRAARLLPPSMLGKRPRDTTSIYEAVKEPYMYVHGFHRLIALLQGRYSATKILRIAKALASIRPSFIACTRTLNRQDLVFMEKCFQRTLFEYEDFMAHVSSPALVCRRTGEVAAVNKEFTALTGWTREVLLGQEPNRNANRPGGGASGTPSSQGNGGNAPRALLAAAAAAAAPSDGAPQPLFLAELMDDDNVIEFYEDFAQLAFGDSRGSVNRKCRLLKYRTRQQLDAAAAAAAAGSSSSSSATGDPSATTSGSGAGTTTSILSSRVARIDGEHGIAKIERDGKLECSYCWHIRRDTFDIPMMIVMNFLPCYYPNQEPHQLAV